MEFIRPRLLAPVVRVAERQEEYEPIDAVQAVNPHYWAANGCHNTMIMAVSLTGEERQRIINGESIYIALLTYGRPQQPLLVSVGPDDMAAWHNLAVDPRSPMERERDATAVTPIEVIDVRWPHGPSAHDEAAQS